MHKPFGEVMHKLERVPVRRPAHGHALYNRVFSD